MMRLIDTKFFSHLGHGHYYTKKQHSTMNMPWSGQKRKTTYRYVIAIQSKVVS
jgi:hypothetical protein